MKNAIITSMIDEAKIIIKQVGGANVVAEWLSKDVSSVYRFTYPKERGGTGGIRNPDYQDIIIEKSKSLEKPVQRQDFFPSS